MPKTSAAQDAPPAHVTEQVGRMINPAVDQMREVVATYRPEIRTTSTWQQRGRGRWLWRLAQDVQRLQLPMVLILDVSDWGPGRCRADLLVLDTQQGKAVDDVWFERCLRSRVRPAIDKISAVAAAAARDNLQAAPGIFEVGKHMAQEAITNPLQPNEARATISWRKGITASLVH